MPLVRRALSAAATVLLAGAALVGSPATASAAEEVPTTPYCFTVDGTGFCVVLGVSVNHYPDADNGDATAALTANVGAYCTGKLDCSSWIDFRPVEVGRTGVVVGDVAIDDVHVTTLRVPEVCVPGGCAGPYLVPVYAPMVTGDAATIWLLGQDTSEPCWLTVCP